MNLLEYRVMNKLKQGNYTLVCYIDNQYRSIEPDKLVDRIDDTYIFTNGYASNCTILHSPYPN